ncbi:MAG: FixH family protein [Flavobacteriaceae bacterium]|nr:FixH family protein [Flavobacteriaceae bacterium]
MKINWGTGLAIVMFLFIVFILSFVYKTFTNDKYDHHLVSEEYYKDEINYQQEIDATSSAKKLNEPVTIKNTEKGIMIIFPSDLENKKIEGTIDFQRASNINLDLTIPIELTNNKLLISKEKLVKGLYNVKIDWSVNNTKYLFKEKYTY